MKLSINKLLLMAAMMIGISVTSIAKSDTAYEYTYMPSSNSQYSEDKLEGIYENINSKPFVAESNNQYSEDEITDSYIYLSSQPSVGYSYSPYNQ